MRRRFNLNITAATLQNLRTTSVTQTTIALAWDVYPGATGYEVRRNGTLISTPAGTTYSNSGHTAGTQYTYAVRPVVGGSGVASAEASIVVTTVGAGTLLLFDGFDYDVAKTEPGSSEVPSGPAYAKFTSGGWAGVKRKPDNSRSFFMWTVSQAEMQAACGYTGPLPGGGSRCLKVEADNAPDGRDVYLATTAVPANVWFQFWMFVPWGSGENSYHQSRYKQFYPSNNSYPSNTNKWLIQVDQRAFGPWGGDNTYPSALPGSPPLLFFVLRDAMVSPPNYSLDPDNSSKLGPNLTATAQQGALQYQQWTLVKLHFDTSNNSSGVYEAWLRPYGGAWRKVSEWIGGVTPNFTWSGFGAGGHSILQIPSTIGWTTDGTNYIFYMDDFAMADSESALPQYG